MKNFISNYLLKTKVKKTISQAVIFTLLVNILSPWILWVTYAGTLPTYTNSITQNNVSPVAQIDELTLPRDIVVWDVLNITISGTTISQSFDTDSLTTAELLNTKIDLRPEVISTFDSVSKKYTITSQIPWIAFYISNLTITRSNISPNETVWNVVAVAQVAEVSIPQDLFFWDTINFSINWTPLIESFSWTKDLTLNSLATQITSSTQVSASYSGTTSKITLTSKTPWIDFSMSAFVVTSSAMSAVNTQVNIAPVAQVEEINFPRNLYSDETVVVNISWSTITQPFTIDYATTLINLSNQIDTLSFVNSTFTWWKITITSEVPWIPFATWSIDISWGYMTGINLVPNVLSVAQRNDIIVPRVLALWDTIHFNIWATHLTQSFSWTSTDTIIALNDQISALSNVYVSAFNPLTRNISIKSKNAWTAFSNPNLYITTSVNSQNITSNVVAQTQVSKLSFPRSLVSWDKVSTILNWSPYFVNYATWSNETIQSFSDLIENANSWVINTSVSGNNIIFFAVVSWTPFTLQPLILENSLTPTVLVANKVPVKQTNTIDFSANIISWDTISLNVDGNNLTQGFNSNEATTLQDLNTQIDNLSTVVSTLSWKTISIEATTAWNWFSVWTITTTWANINSVNTQSWVLETKASVFFDFNSLTSTWDYVNLWDCNIAFTGWAWNDFDCSDNVANIDSANILDIATLTALVKSVYGISDITEWSLVLSWTWNKVIATASNWINGNINFSYSGWVDALSVIDQAWVTAQNQIDTLTLPRDFALWDTFKTVINWITVTQNYLSSSWVSFDNLVSQIDALPDLSATGSNNVITITSDLNKIFNISSTSFENTISSTLVISNVVAVAEKKIINFPSTILPNDLIEISVDTTVVSATWSLSDLAINITSSTQVNASLSWSLGLVLEAKNAWNSFSVDSLKITNNSSVTPIDLNISSQAQVDDLTIPFSVSSWDDLVVNVNWTQISQSFTTDETTTLSLLNTKINDLVWVNSSVDITSKTFTITSKTAWTPFTASFLATGSVINSSIEVANVNSGAQIDKLVVNRELKSWDAYNLDIAWHTLTWIFNTDKTTTLQDLNTQIDNLAEVSSTFDWDSTFIIIASVPGNAFSGATLTISTTYSSINKIQNIFAQTQIDSLTLQRNFITWDTITLVLNWNTYNQVFSGIHITTVNDFISQVNSSQTWVTLSNVWNDIIFTANIAWIPFTVNSFSLENSSISSEIQPNVVAVKQETEITIPTLVLWDTISFTVNGTWITESFTWDEITTINNLLNNINTSTPEVVATYWSSKIHLISSTAWVPFTVSSVSLVNNMLPIETITNVPAVAQITKFTPGWLLREEIVFRTVINWINYDYLTASWDTLTDVVNGIYSSISNTWVIVSTWVTYIELTSVVPWVAFSYDSQVLDLNPPIISVDTVVNETLKAWDVSTWSLTISESWDIYAVLSWSVVTSTWDLLNLVNAWSWFIVMTWALAWASYNITPPSWISDWLYNIVSIDDFWNISQIVSGFVIVDNTAPVLTILTQSWITINNNTVLIEWTTESNTQVQIVWNWIVNTISDWSWAFSWIVILNQNTSNLIDVIATDLVWNISFAQVTINHDNLSPVINSISYPASTNSLTWNVNLWSELGLLVEAFSWISLVASWMTDWSWNISLNLPLALNSANNFSIVLTDLAWNYTTQTWIVIVQDSIAPNIVLNPLPSIVNIWSINISGTTESNSNITITNAWNTYTWSSDNLWLFNINVLLDQAVGQQTVNNINLTVTDLAWNSSNTWIVITEDSTPNSLIISTPNQTTNLANISITWSTKIGATVDIWWNNATVLWNWDFLSNYTLTQNTLNDILVTSTDIVWNVLTWNILVTHDNIAPTINITTSNAPTNNLAINLVWTTESNSVLNITWGSGSFVWVSDGLWNFNIVVNLNPWVLNTLSITSTDIAWNIWTWSFAIVQDPVVNFVNILSNAVNDVNTDMFVFSWTTKANANLVVTWWSWVVNLTALNDGSFTWIVTLNKNSSNNIVVSSTDSTLTTATWGFVVNHDDVKPVITNFAYPTTTTQANAILTWDTENLAVISANNWVNIINSTASSTWNFTLTFPLALNTLNTINLSVTDVAWNISTWVLNILHDNVAPVISNITTSQAVNSGIMTFTYSFDTNETSNWVIYIGSGSNVLATLVASWSTSWLTHSWIISGFDSTKTYYYFIDTTDNLGNNYQTTVTSIDTIPVILDPNATTKLDITNLPASNSWVVLSWSITVWSWFELIWETLPNNQLYYYFTWGLISNVLTWGATLPQIELDNPINFYTTTWTIVFEKKLISWGEQIVWNIKQIFSPAITIWGTPTIILDKPAKIKFVWYNTWYSKFAYRKTWTSTWTIKNIEVGDCTPNYTTTPVCAYTSWSDIIIKTLHFTDFALVSEQTIQQTSSSWGGGWWGWVTIDYCPTWDYSPNYYDKSCWIKPSSSITSEIEDVKQIITDADSISKTKKTIWELLRKKLMTEARIKHSQYLWLDIVYIKWYKDSSMTWKLSIEIAKSKLNYIDKKRYINIINEFIISKYNLEVAEKKYQTLKNKYVKQSILLKSVLKKLDK